MWQPVSFAGLIHRFKCAALVVFRNFRRIFGAGLDTAKPTPQTPRQSFQQPLDVVIAHRAERLCNRDRALVAKYVRTNTILSRGRFSE